MKHLDEQHERYLDRLIDCASLVVPEALRPTLLRHLDWTLEQNQTMNLTSITEPQAAVRLHVIDSLEALPELNDAPEGPFLDLGTGAGFPGFPLAVVSGRRAVLLDSVSKKVRALGSFLASEDMDKSIHAVAGRAETLAVDQPGRYAAVTVRAVSQLPSLVELAAPLLASGGVLIAMKASIEDDEVRRGDLAGALVGMERVGRRGYVLPDGEETRSILTYRRIGNPEVLIPRRVGLAQKKPLG